MAESIGGRETDTPAKTIVREVVQLHKKYFGRGPVTSKIYTHPDSILILMYEGHTVSEDSLEHAGQGRAVAQARVDVSEARRAEFIATVERHMGRRVVGFMSSSQQEPSFLSHVYVLEPTDLLQEA